MQFSEEGEKNLMDMEGFVSEPTPDLAGHSTIGYGHKIKVGEKFGKITKPQALDLLRKDVKPIGELLNNYLPIGLKQNQFDALVIFIFNIGQTGFLNSTVFKDIKEKKFEAATIPWRRWINISKYEKDKETGETKRILVPVKGLINRREREIELFERA